MAEEKSFEPGHKASYSGPSATQLEEESSSRLIEN
jgi:hypothetical protein